MTFNKLEYTLINTIRRNPNLIKSVVASKLDTSWSTVSKVIKDLERQNILSIQQNDVGERNSQKALYKAKVSINRNFEHYIGISVGSSNIKIVFMGFDFYLLKKQEVFLTDNMLIYFERMLSKYQFICEESDEFCRWCAPTPNDIDTLTKTLMDICANICELKNTTKFNVSAITFTLPGHIDFEQQKIIHAANLCNNNIRNSNLSRLITSTIINKLEKNKIAVFIDHNIKSSTIAEEEHLFSSSDVLCKNMMVIYLGKGLGIGMVLNNRLYRGNQNLAGQLGHITLQNGRELEEIIRNDIFSSRNEGADFASLSSIELKNILAKNIAKKNDLINLLADTIKNIVQILGIEDIVFSGKFDSIFEEIEMSLNNKFEELNFSGLHLTHSYYGEYSAAVGAAMSCFYNLYEIPFEWL